MADGPSNKGVLFLAAVVTLAALSVAARLNRMSPREIVAPEAWAALDRRESDRAAELFEQALRQRPRDAVLHFGLGSAEYGRGRTASSLASLQRAVEIDPRFDDALVLLGKVAYERGETELAIGSMRQASALRPRDAHVTELLEQWQHEASVQSGYLEKAAEHFRILYEGGTQQAIGDRIAHVLEGGYWRVGKTLNRYPAGVVTVTLYTNQEFQDITRSPSWSGGNYDGQIRLAVGGALSAGVDLDRVATHELVHAIIADIAPRRIPSWLNEGFATYLESSDHAWTARALRNAADVVPLETLANGFGRLDGERAIVAYAESATAADILCAQLGTNVGAFLQNVGEGHSIDQALLDFQIQPNAFTAEWRRRVGLR